MTNSCDNKLNQANLETSTDFAPIALDTFFPYQVVLLADKIGKTSAASAKRLHGLNISQWRVLAALADIPGRTATQVVAVTPMDQGIVSRAVKSLIDVGLVRRKASNTDGRLAHLYLTAAGKKKYAAIAQEMIVFDASLRTLLTSIENKQLDKILRKLVTGFSSVQ